MKNIVLIALQDDGQDCKVQPFTSMDKAVSELKRQILALGNWDQDMKNKIRKAPTYEKLVNICGAFNWGENDTRLYFIKKI